MKIKTIAIVLISMLIVSCGEEPSDGTAAESQETEQEENMEPVEEISEELMENKGIGPITSLEIGEIDNALVEEGIEAFNTNCTACHKMGKLYIGPDLTHVVNRRSPEWIMNMILNPEEMTANDPIAKGLLAEFLSPMANQNLTEDQARAILEYLRSVN